MKRKCRDNIHDISPPHSKRRRKYSNIEDGIAYLSLNGTSTHSYMDDATNSISVEEIPAEIAMDTEMSGSSSYPTQPVYTVEEPTIPEITMKISSWFEPERDSTLYILRRYLLDKPDVCGSTGIVITDLDSFTQSDDEDEQSVTVNAALLEKIRANVVDQCPIPLAPTSQALVLFRPLPWASAMNEGENREALKQAHKEKKVHSELHMTLDGEDMAMEVEV